MSKTLPTVAVIGSGTMGAGIAEVAAAAGHPVLIFDIAPEAVVRAIDGIRQRLASRVSRGKLATEQADALLARLVPAAELSNLADAQLVIEAASERLEVKKALFEQLAAICSPSTLLVSNTSSISITAIAAGIKHPERVAGLHFFNPAPVMKLVEVVSGLATSTEVVEQLCQWVSDWGKQQVRCRSTPGFIVNRVARPFYAEAWRALEEQVAAPEVIDAALRDGGGFPMGPLALTDLIGQDVNFAVTCSVFNACWQDRRYQPSLLQQELALAGRLGKKSGQGVYRWPAEAQPERALAAVSAERAAKRIKRDVVTELDEILLLETTGETALALSLQHGRPVVSTTTARVIRWCWPARKPPHRRRPIKQLSIFNSRAKKCCRSLTIPACWCGVRWRCWLTKRWTRCKKGSPARRISIPPCAWALTTRAARWRGESHLGWGRVLRLLENLQRHYGEERYRPCSLLRQKALMEKHHEQ
ncbi:3-hydroxyacyl-CoA dehydrogenase [Klebsiella grimontii]|uniref:3-hydroxyacyl-CoA dehydrogenase n=1 Tax=Klebsiella grimontii TaxID=2058152 RepID=A0A7H4P4J4_9ENTR|nr:3-hydroxyacyl-CoA dehydrogenase [Klebsiella grimontii]